MNGRRNFALETHRDSQGRVPLKIWNSSFSSPAGGGPAQGAPLPHHVPTCGRRPRVEHAPPTPTSPARDRPVAGQKK